MTEPPEPQHPSQTVSFLDRVLGPNPYPADDPRHEYWVRASRLAGEETAQFEAESLKAIPADGVSILPSS